MTRFVNAAASPTPAEWRHTPGKRAQSISRSLAKFIGIACTLLILAQYLAGYFFLWSFRMDAKQTTPLTISRYAYYYSDSPRIARRLLSCSAAGAMLTLAMLLVLVVPRRRSLHGDARFATRREIAAAGLLSGSGIILGRVGGIGRFGGRYLTLSGQQGVSLSAQPRAGKGVGVVVPNLLTWPGSVVCVDIKKENWTLTAGHRHAQEQATYLFDPLSRERRTARWNPLDYVAEDANQRISDLQLIANMFFPDPVNTDPFWMSSARSLFLGIALYLFSTPSYPRTIGEILRQGMADDEEGFSHHWRRVIQGRMRGRDPLPEQCVRALYDVIDLAPQTASSIRKTFTSKLELWLNPVLDAATSASDFDLRALRTRPMSIYLGVDPKDLERLAPLMSLFFQQAIALQTDQLPEHNLALKLQVLMLLDECPAIGRIPILAKTSGFLPGYNVRSLLIMQTPSQLREVYGEDGAKTLLKTQAARIYFAPKDMDDAEEIAKELGFTTVKVKSYSKPVADVFASKSQRQRSVTVSEQRRPLMLAQEVREIGPRRAIVFAESLRPILAKKIRYYERRDLRKRVCPPPVVHPIEPILPSTRPRSAQEEANGVQTSRVATGELRTREATLEDIERINELTLEDFAADFSRVEIPVKAEGELMTESELQRAAQSFLNALHER